jgi:hypothetical protein
LVWAFETVFISTCQSPEIRHASGPHPGIAIRVSDQPG